MMTSIAIVNARGGNSTSCHDTYFQTLPGGGELRGGEAELQVLEIGFDQGCDGIWYVAKTVGRPYEFTRH